MPQRLQRRAFLHTLTGAVMAPAILRAAGDSRAALDSAPAATRRPAAMSMASFRLPEGIRKGQTIGVVAPASGVMPREVRDFVSLCDQWGVHVKLGSNIGKRSGYLAASDQDRADELMRFIEDPSIDAIVSGRGGYGVMRILPMLDFESIKQAGKLIMGFSDITALLIAVNQLSGLVTYHGPVASSTFDDFTTTSVTNVVRQSESGSAKSDVSAMYCDAKLKVLHAGTASGRLTGGNLTMIASTLGTPYEIDTRGAILFLEEISEEPYRIDRMLTQLRLAGKLQSCAAIAIGNFRDCENRPGRFPEPSYSLSQVLHELIGDLGIPAVYGLPFGHVRSKLTIPLGIQAELNATDRSLRLMEPAVI
ncbi:MAG: LD-carboxypeptidase [Candidatus Kapabacteria bacterium]|nr:LD-carboxypeptidase [Candidatus Kapabacteria bacterium]